MTLFHDRIMADKTFIVTGASSGLGRAVAQQLARHGARVLALGRSLDRLSETMASLHGSGHEIFAGDLSSADAAYDSIKSARALVDTGINGVFHSAGISMIRMARITKGPHIDDIMGASLLGAMGLARAAASKGFFSPSGGSLLFMSSVAGHRGQAGMSAYGASRAAISGLVKNLACELAPQSIRVNSIVAGAVKTEMHENATRRMDQATLNDYENRHPLGFGTPDDIANSALFLLSDASRWVTGTSMLVDGGYMAK
ncbi:short-chain dehydrogenase/reductase [Amylibacter marinus]|uniref:Short-chain dehydrogenase/reductase n=2 Tax=Amylibacter marinus TaxID=1475483 RepID=A0ABQ5VXJ1_9RHOB|nr:short-chain dehydrogenase/reductase [Amylibacter marinus]